MSLAMDEDASFGCSVYPTPGYPNTDSGYCAWQSGKAVPVPVAITSNNLCCPLAIASTVLFTAFL